jgi:hypothetical protein
MATITRVSVWLNSEDLAWAKQRARRDNKTLSAVVSEALLKERRAEALDELIADLGGEDITEAERQALHKELGWTTKRSNARKKAARAQRKPSGLRA